MREVTIQFTVLIALASTVLGCTGVSPTNPGVIAREPTRLYWGIRICTPAIRPTPTS